MAKTRVYELARDLNLTNQILLSKLNELDISVKSHMSSLDDEAVAKVRTVIFGKKEESIEETRVKPTVIRRRKKKVPLEVVVEPTPDTVEITAEQDTQFQVADAVQQALPAIDDESVVLVTYGGTFKENTLTRSMWLIFSMFVNIFRIFLICFSMTPAKQRRGIKNIELF